MSDDECIHADAIRDVTPSALGCEECLKIGSPWVASAFMPDLRPCRLLRRLAEPPRHEALPWYAPSDHRRLRPARRLGVVLHRRDHARSQRSRHGAQRSDPALLLNGGAVTASAAFPGQEVIGRGAAPLRLQKKGQ